MLVSSANFHDLTGKDMTCTFFCDSVLIYFNNEKNVKITFFKFYKLCVEDKKF